ncbi:MAG: DUF1287 domain-containing protein [Bacillota bacterium]
MAACILIAIMVLFLGWVLSRLGHNPHEYLDIPQVVENMDANRNSIPDALDFVKGARREVQNHTQYDAAYYSGGYPPEGRGACSDVIWRAFREAGYDLKGMVDEDIRKTPAAYGRTGVLPDPNIDFRRVTNLVVFFERHGRELTNKVIPGDKDNLIEWQPGDIVVFGPPWEHIGIISDRRRPDGVPFVLNNAAPVASEDDYLLRWPSRVTHHFRYSKYSREPEAKDEIQVEYRRS